MSTEPLPKPDFEDEELAHVDDAIIGKAVRWSLLAIGMIALLFGATVLVLKRKLPPPPPKVTEFAAPVLPDRPRTVIPVAIIPSFLARNSSVCIFVFSVTSLKMH